MDAIESGIVKIPRVPVADDSVASLEPTFRDLWLHIRENLPRRGIKDSGTPEGAPIPKQLEAALISLYRDYARHHAQWSEANMGRPPVFIVVCSNTSVSKLLFDWIAGFERELRTDRESWSLATSISSRTKATAAGAIGRTAS